MSQVALTATVDALAHGALLTFPFWLGYLARVTRRLSYGIRR